MMTFEHWLAFVVASAALLAIPGPTILTVVSYSLSHGAGSRAALVLAVALGDATALAFSLIGLGALLTVSGFWFTVVKVIGGVYLIWLGARMFLAGLRSDRGAAPADAGGLPPGGRRRLFFNTWLVTALNPKGIVFFVAFLPQFVDRTQPVAPQLWMLAVTFVVLAALNAGLYAAFANGARRALRGGGARRVFEAGGGMLLMSAGGWALLARRAT